MTSSFENNHMSRREFLDKASKIVALGLLGTTFLELCGPRSPEIVDLPVVLKIPLGGTFSIDSVETRLPRPLLKLNKTLTEKLLHERIVKSIVPIQVHIFPDDWVRSLPDGRFRLISDQTYQSLPQQEQIPFDSGLTDTIYDARTEIAQGAEVAIAAGRFLKAAKNGTPINFRDGIVEPITGLNRVFYHEVVYHALLRHRDSRKLNMDEEIEEERNARKGEAEWVKNLTRKANAVSNDQLFLVPY